jgi:hypothetical protein
VAPAAPHTAPGLSSAAARGAGAACLCCGVFPGQENREEEDLALAVGGASERGEARQAKAPRGEHHLPHDLVVSAWEDRTGRWLAFPSPSPGFLFPRLLAFAFYPTPRTERGPLISPCFFYRLLRRTFCAQALGSQPYCGFELAIALCPSGCGSSCRSLAEADLRLVDRSRIWLVYDNRPGLITGMKKRGKIQADGDRRLHCLGGKANSVLWVAAPSEVTWVSLEVCRSFSRASACLTFHFLQTHLHLGRFRCWRGKTGSGRIAHRTDKLMSAKSHSRIALSRAIWVRNFVVP